MLPTDWRSFASLGLAYVQEARVTADPSYYPKAEGVLRRSLELRPAGQLRGDGGDGRAGRRPPRLRRLRWAGASGRGDQPVQRQRLRRDRRRAGGARSLRRRVRDVPDDGGHAARPRLLRAGLLRPRAAGRRRRRDPGDARPRETSPARRPTPRGPRTSSASSTSTAGDLGRGRARVPRAASRPTPSSCRRSPASRRWRGRAGDLQDAIDGYTDVAQRYPAPEYVIALGDLYAAAGQPEQARPQYDAGPRGATALPRQRRQHRPGARAVRRRPRRSAGRARRRSRRVGRSGTRPRGRRLRVGAARERARPRGRALRATRRWRSATATRCSRSTPG